MPEWVLLHKERPRVWEVRRVSKGPTSEGLDHTSSVSIGWKEIEDVFRLVGSCDVEL